MPPRPVQAESIKARKYASPMASSDGKIDPSWFGDLGPVVSVGTLSTDSNHRFVTDAQIANWNAGGADAAKLAIMYAIALG